MGNYFPVKFTAIVSIIFCFGILISFPHCLSSCRLALSTFPRMNTNSSDEFFQATNHAEQTFRKMETYLQHKQLCDVLLIAGDHKIPAHRLAFVLHLALITLITSASVYFRSPSGLSWLDCWCVQSGRHPNLGSVHHRNNKITLEMERKIHLLLIPHLTGEICKPHAQWFPSK